MRTSLLALVFVAPVIVACAKTAPPAAPETPQADAPASSATSSADVSGATPAPSASAAPASATPATTAAATPATQKGLKADQVALFGFRSDSDPDRCYVVPGSASDAAAFKKEWKGSVAKSARKLKLSKDETPVEACPLDNVVGTCADAKGYKHVIVDYYAPTFTADSAMSHCEAHMLGTWVP